MKLKSFLQLLLFIGVFVLDRITKMYALFHWVEQYVINRYLFFQLTFNRGVSWGMLNYEETPIFVAVTILICLITAGLAWYAYLRARQGHAIFGELCVLAGSLSNIIDRLLYGHVIDFIIVHKGTLEWPAFNIADSFIVFGVACMFVQLFLSHE